MPEIELENAYVELVDIEAEKAPRAVLIPAINVTPAPTIIEPAPVPELLPSSKAEPLQDNIQAVEIETIEQNNPPPLTKYEVQLGAYDERQRSLQAWEDISTQVPYLADQLHRVEPAVIKAGNIVYRLRVMGFAKFSTAAKFCEKLKSDDVDCYAVKAE